MHDWETKLLRCLLYGTRAQFATSSSSTVRTRHNRDYLVTRLDESFERWHCGLGRPEENNFHLLIVQLEQPVGVRRSETQRTFTQQYLRVSSLVVVEAFDKQHAI